MKKLFLPFVAVLLASCSTVVQEAGYQVIPRPNNVTLTQEEPFKLDKHTLIGFPKGDEQMKRNADFLAGYVEEATGYRPYTREFTDSKLLVDAVILEIDPNVVGNEGYQLTVSSSNIFIKGATPAGVFYGIQTLRKSIPAVATDARISFPAVTITDAPRFAYRGAHFDISRHFFTPEEVKTYLDMMALHNMNTFHWHLSDDQGWRIEIKKYPLLTEIGSKRSGTVIGHNTGKYDDIPYGGFFTQEQIKDVVAYAAERYITVVPEIDMPGHMQAALAAYPHLGCTGGPYEVWRMWGISEEVLCAGNDSVLTFIDDVLTEIMEMFPSEYIHVGGDECPKVRWEKCPKCQARIKELGLKSDKQHTKEERLQSFVINHAEKFLNNHGRQIIGWDEILEGGVAPNATVMSWRGEAGGIEAAKMQHDVIMVPNDYFYFDYYQCRDKTKEPEAIGGYVPLSKVYSYNPMPEALTPEQHHYIKGVQANLWTEYIPTFAQAQYMLLPRWSALAEVQWTQQPQRDYTQFTTERLPRMIEFYKRNGWNYCDHSE
jgi:hexosaminidase